MLEILEGGIGFLISDFPNFKLINHHALSLSTARSHSSLSFLIAIYLSARLSWHYEKKTQWILVMVIMLDNGDDDMYRNCRLKQRAQKTTYLASQRLPYMVSAYCEQLLCLFQQEEQESNETIDVIPEKESNKRVVSVSKREQWNREWNAQSSPKLFFDQLQSVVSKHRHAIKSHVLLRCQTWRVLPANIWVWQPIKQTVAPKA